MKPPRYPRVPKRLIQEAALSYRSPLFRWMHRNHASLQDAIGVAGRPNWRALAETFGSLGLTDATGKPPTSEAARQTWLKVKKEVLKAGTPAVVSKPKPPVAEARETPPDPHTPVSEPWRDAPVDFDLTPATPRKRVFKHPTDEDK